MQIYNVNGRGPILSARPLPWIIDCVRCVAVVLGEVPRVEKGPLPKTAVFPATKEGGDGLKVPADTDFGINATEADGGGAGHEQEVPQGNPDARFGSQSAGRQV